MFGPAATAVDLVNGGEAVADAALAAAPSIIAANTVAGRFYTLLVMQSDADAANWNVYWLVTNIPGGVPINGPGGALATGASEHGVAVWTAPAAALAAGDPTQNIAIFLWEQKVSCTAANVFSCANSLRQLIKTAVCQNPELHHAAAASFLRLHDQICSK